MKNILIDNVETKYFLKNFCIIHNAIGITFLKFYLVVSLPALSHRKLGFLVENRKREERDLLSFTDLERPIFSPEHFSFS